MPQRLLIKRCQKGSAKGFITRMVAFGHRRSVAQLVEQRSPKPPVGGSSPPAPARVCRGGGMADALA